MASGARTQGGEQVRMKVVQAVGGTRKGAVDEKKMTSGVP